MTTIQTIRATRRGLGGPRMRSVMAAIVGTGLAMLVGCSSSGQPADSPGSSGSAPSASSGTSSSGNISSGNRNGGQGNQGTGTFTVAFARCMRANGVPDFPDPNGQAGQLGPGSGIDPASPEFQSAINGPCKSLAPPGWVDSGKVSR